MSTKSTITCAGCQNIATIEHEIDEFPKFCTTCAPSQKLSAERVVTDPWEFLVPAERGIPDEF